MQGPQPARENAPAYIDEALAAGFEAEVDLRCKNGEFYLGHDFAKFYVPIKWLEKRHERLLLHLKDVQAARLAPGLFRHWHTFCHVADPFTVTSQGKVWLHDLSLLPLDVRENYIIPLITPEQKSLFRSGNYDWTICSDYVLPS
jgi:hypothetical protein